MLKFFLCLVLLALCVAASGVCAQAIGEPKTTARIGSTDLLAMSRDRG